MKKGYDFKKYFIYDFTKFLGFVPFVLVYRPKYYFVSKLAKDEYKKFSKTGSALIVSNHFDLTDPIKINLIYLMRRKHILSAKDVVPNKVAGFIFKALLSIFINREKLELSEYKEIMHCLKNNNLVAMFPEGHMNKNQGTLDELKDGASVFAIKGNVPVIPIYFRKRKNIFERQTYGIGEPIYLNELGYTMDTLKEATALIKNKMEEAMDLVLNKKKVK